MNSSHLHLFSCIPGSTASLDSLSSSARSGVLSMYVVPICLPICPLCHASVSLRADGVPIVLRICKGRAFEHGPFSLGRWYLPIGITALAWVVVSTVRMSEPCISVTGFQPWCAHVDSLCQEHDALSSVSAIAILGMLYNYCVWHIETNGLFACSASRSVMGFPTWMLSVLSVAKEVLCLMGLASVLPPLPSQGFRLTGDSLYQPVTAQGCCLSAKLLIPQCSEGAASAWALSFRISVLG